MASPRGVQCGGNPEVAAQPPVCSFCYPAQLQLCLCHRGWWGRPELRDRGTPGRMSPPQVEGEGGSAHPPYSYPASGVGATMQGKIWLNNDAELGTQPSPCTYCVPSTIPSALWMVTCTVTQKAPLQSPQFLSGSSPGHKTNKQQMDLM